MARRGRSRAEHGIAKEQSAVKPAFGGLPSSVTVQRSAQHRATFPKGKALRSRAAYRICSLRGRERRFALNMPRSAEKARSFAEKFFILRDFGRRRLDYYGEQQYN